MKNPHILSVSLVIAPSGPIPAGLADLLRAQLQGEVNDLLGHAQLIVEDYPPEEGETTSPPPEVVVIITAPPPG